MAHNEAIDAVLSIIEGDRDSDIQIKLIKQLLVIYEPSKAKVDAIIAALNILESDGDGDIKLKTVRLLKE